MRGVYTFEVIFGYHTAGSDTVFIQMDMDMDALPGVPENILPCLSHNF